MLASAGDPPSKQLMLDGDKYHIVGVLTALLKVCVCDVWIVYCMCALYVYVYEYVYFHATSTTLWEC